MSETNNELNFVSAREHKASTLVQLLQRRASEPNGEASYKFLPDGSTEPITLTFSELDLAARAVAVRLQQLNMKGERALLLYAPGLDFIVGFFGCLYAGVIAVPVYPPNPAQPVRTLKRLQAIIADAGAKVAMTTSAILKKVEKLAANAPELQLLHWLASDSIANENDARGEWRDADVTSQNIAFLQYTSGSTGAPKGVMITHQNLLHNAEMVYQAFSHKPDDSYVSWLPTFHDMGLMAGVLQPLYGGFPVVLMSPVSFLQNPFRWLQTISSYQATTSGGPNFAYDLCLRKISAEQRATLDLSSWSIAFNGAEPVRRETLERFAKTFASCGFRKEALYPCYGLAEATLIVSGGSKFVGPVTKNVETPALENHRVVETTEANARSLVSCGNGLIDEEIAIVHPVTLAKCLPHEVGEIWVRSASVGRGYWNRETESAQTFRAHTADTNDGPFLRTGDLGFLQEGKLFVTGRHKDLIIIRGHNHYPQDIELTAERSQPALRAGCGAAFTIEVDGEERLVLAQEIDVSRQPDLEGVFAGIRQSVSEIHELQVYAIALLKPGSIPKTSSGKIQRRACRAGFLKGELEEIERNTLQDEPALEEKEESFIRCALLSAEPSKRNSLMESYLLEQISQVSKIKIPRSRSTRSLASFGLDSLMAVELKNRIEADLELTVPLTALLQEGGVAQLAGALLEQLSEPVVSNTVSLATTQPHEEQPLSYVQQSIWFLHQLAPELAAYNVAFAARIRSQVDVATLRRALQILVDRHPSLRTRFLTRDTGPIQQVEARAEIDFEQIDASAIEVNEAVVAEAHRPFDIEHGPVFRARLFTASGEQVLLLTAHHLVIDGWSFWLLLDELRALYAAEKNHVGPSLAPITFQYSDFVRWQNEMLAGSQGELLWNYWQNELWGDLPVLNLPSFRARPRAQSFNGASHSLPLTKDLTRRLQEIAKAEGTTLYTVLVAAFLVLLHRYSGQEDILIGSPAAGRTRAEFEEIVGCFFNAVVLRAKVSGDQTFNEFLQEVRGTVLRALEHQDYPSHLLAQRLQPKRQAGHGNLFQTSFIFQQPRRQPTGLTFESNSATDELALEFFPVQRSAARSELELELIETKNGLFALWTYNTDIFDTEIISRMAGHFQQLLEAVVKTPQQRISQLPLLTESEREELLVQWSKTHIDYSSNLTVNKLFEEQVAKTPLKLAAVAGESSASFEQLNEQANSLANLLTELQR